MKTLKYLGVATLITANLGLASAGHAADVVDFSAAGSSAQFSVFTSAFLTQGYTSHYSLKTQSPSLFAIADSGAPKENSQVAIYWQGSAGNYRIAVYYQVDSTVGVRAYFNSDTLVAPTTNTGLPAGGNVGQPGSGDAIPPSEVLAAVNGTAVGIGATDITPEDARVATQRSLSLGYNASANPIKSAVTGSSAVANPVAFSLTAKSFTLKPLGAVPIMIFINNNSGSQFASLSGANLNINSFTLAGFLSGQLNRTSDLLPTNGAAQDPVHTYIREPLSGTYNTTEYTNPEATAELPFTNGLPSGQTAASGGQELNVSSNPLNEPVGGSADPGAPANSGRIRAIGTGELVKAVNGDTTDALGYAFWSAGNFSGKTNLRYLTVDGADPLQDSYTGGSVTSPTVTFRNIINGGYPLWSILRVVEPQSPTTVETQIIGSAISAANGTDFVPASLLRVFRSYHVTPYTIGGVSNGNNGTPANGGDVGGAVFSINNDQDYFTDFGGDLTNLRQ